MYCVGGAKETISRSLVREGCGERPANSLRAFSRVKGLANSVKKPTESNCTRFLVGTDRS